MSDSIYCPYTLPPTYLLTQTVTCPYTQFIPLFMYCVQSSKRQEREEGKKHERLGLVGWENPLKVNIDGSSLFRFPSPPLEKEPQQVFNIDLFHNLGSKPLLSGPGSPRSVPSLQSSAKDGRVEVTDRLHRHIPEPYSHPNEPFIVHRTEPLPLVSLPPSSHSFSVKGNGQK